MPEYRVGVWLEEVVVINIEAENEDEARRKVHELVEEEGGSTYDLPYKSRHREFHVADVFDQASSHLDNEGEEW